MTENSPKFVQGHKLTHWNSYKIPKNINPITSMPPHVAIELKITDRKEQCLTYNGEIAQITVKHSAEAMETQRKSHYFPSAERKKSFTLQTCYLGFHTLYLTKRPMADKIEIDARYRCSSNEKMLPDI